MQVSIKTFEKKNCMLKATVIAKYLLLNKASSQSVGNFGNLVLSCHHCYLCWLNIKIYGGYIASNGIY